MLKGSARVTHFQSFLDENQTDRPHPLHKKKTTKKTQTNKHKINMVYFPH
jgi:hypothetical protein